MKSLLTVAAVLLLAASSARAGILTANISLSPTSGSTNYSSLYWQVPHGGWSIPNVDASSLQILDTVSDDASSTDGLTFAGTLSSDPHIELLEHITNTSATPWSSFAVEVDPDANSALSNLVGLFPSSIPPGFTSNFTASSTSGNVLTFSTGTVAPGQTVLLDVAFDITLINNTFPGNFSYNIANSPVAAVTSPEPASLTLLASSSLLLIKRRRRI